MALPGRGTLRNLERGVRLMGGVRVGGMAYEGTTGPLYPWKDGLLVGGKVAGYRPLFSAQGPGLPSG